MTDAANGDVDIPDRTESEDGVLDAVQTDLPVRIRIDGNIREFSIREMEPKDFQKWQRLVNQRFTRKGRSVTANEANFEGLHEDLIALCLYDADDNRVPYNTIAAWGTKVKLTLFIKCRMHNGLDADVVEREGKG